MDKTLLNNYYLTWALDNFDLVMFFLAIIFILFNRAMNRKVHESEIIYRWIALFAVGFTSIYAFSLHAFFPHYTSLKIGWTSTPFEFEVAMAYLAFGLLAILSFNASFGFRAAATIGVLIWMWGDAGGHIYQMIIHSDYSVGNFGSWLWIDIAAPFILLLCILKLKQFRATV